MKCPRCFAQLAGHPYEGVQTDHCVRCRGTWLDAKELSTILALEEIVFSPELVREVLQGAQASIPPGEVASKELCPRCHDLMNALNYSYNSGVVIDVCPRGDGLWFDHLELEKIQVFHEHWNQKVAEDMEKIRHQLRANESTATRSSEARMKDSLSRFGIITRAGFWLTNKLS